MNTPVSRIAISFFCAPILSILCATEFGPPKQVGVTFTPSAQSLAPTWSGGALIFIDNNDTAAPVIHFFENDGHESDPLIFTLPTASVVRVHSVSRGRQGQLALCGTLHDSSGRGGFFLALVPAATSRTSVVVKLDPYIPYLVSIAPDGTIWTQGGELKSGGVAEKTNVSPSTAGILRHFDQKGKFLSGWLPQNSIGLVDWARNLNQFATSATRVGWYSNHAAKYFEWDGQAVKQYAGPSGGTKAYPTGLAITGDQVYLSTKAAGAGTAALLKLNRSAATWEPVSLPQELEAGKFQSLYGGDETQLAVHPVGSMNVALLPLR